MGGRILHDGKKPAVNPPAIALIDPKYLHNLGSIVRAASSFEVEQVWFTGERLLKAYDDSTRIPRELRLKEYNHVQLIRHDRLSDQFGPSVTPVAVELRDNAEQLPEFIHPLNPLYIFGPEDGSIPQTYLRLCHRFVVLPTKHCVNVAAAVYMVLYDRLLKQVQAKALTSAQLPRGAVECETDSC